VIAIGGIADHVHVLARVHPSVSLGAAAVASSPAVGADGTVFFGGMDGKFVAVSPAGTVLWSVATGGQINSSPAIGAQGAVYAASDDGFLYAAE
jgi:outer membrane protein assembly factor BamB